MAKISKMGTGRMMPQFSHLGGANTGTDSAPLREPVLVAKAKMKGDGKQGMKDNAVKQGGARGRR